MNLSQLLAGAAALAPTPEAANDLRRLAAAARSAPATDNERAARLAAERREASRHANIQRYGSELERRTYAALTLLHAGLERESDAYNCAACDLIGDAAASLANCVEERALHAADDAETAEADRRIDQDHADRMNGETW